LAGRERRDAMTILGPSLTPRQRQVYDFIRAYAAKHGYGPTVRALAEHFGFRSARGALSHLRPLEKQGLLQRLAFSVRAIRLVPWEEAGAGAMAVLPRGPSVQLRDGQLVVDFGLGRVVLGREEALRLTRALQNAATNLAGAETPAL
jgi:hypothetical protein